jgi:uncharacterized membrane protein
MSMRKVLSIVLGLLFIALGVLPLINFPIPAITGTVMWILAIIGGLILLVDGYKEHQEMRAMLSTPSYLIGLLLIVLGLIPLLFSLGVIGFELPLAVFWIMDFVFIAGGLFLVIGGFHGW